MRLRDLINLLLLSAVWGSSYALIKVTVDGIPPMTMVAGRLVLGALFLMAMVRVLGLRLPRRPADLGHLTLMAITGNILPFILIAWAQVRITSSLAAVLNATTPFFTVLIAALALRTERLTATKLIGIVIGFTGVPLLTGADLTNLGSSSGQGILALLASSICYGLGFAYARRYLRGEPLSIAAAQISIAALLLLPIALLAGDVGATDLTPGRTAAWVALGLGATGFGYILYYRLIADIGATRASYSTYIIPIVGVAWGWLLFDESMGVYAWIGVAVILGGLAIASGRLRRPPRAATLAPPTGSSE